MRGIFVLGMGILLAGCGVVPNPLARGDKSVIRTVEIRNFVGRIQIEEGRNFALDRDTRAMLFGSETAMVFDGQAPVERYRCDSDGKRAWLDDPKDEGASVQIGDADFGSGVDDLPLIAMVAPDRSIKLVVMNSILFGETGDLAGLEIAMDTCGSLDVGDVGGTLDVALAGQARLDADDAEVVAANLRGESELVVERVRTLSAVAADGAELRAQDVETGYVAAGDAARVEFGVAKGFRAKLEDVAALEVNELRGQSELMLLGASRVEARTMDAESVVVRANDRSEVTLNGKVRRAELVAAGMALVELGEVSLELAVRAEERASIRVERDPGVVAASKIDFNAPWDVVGGD